MACRTRLCKSLVPCPNEESQSKRRRFEPVAPFRMERFFETPAPPHRSNWSAKKNAPQGKASAHHRQPHDQLIRSLPFHTSGVAACFRCEPRHAEFRRDQPADLLRNHPSAQRHRTIFLGKDSPVLRYPHTHHRVAALPLRVRPGRQLDDDHGLHDDQPGSLWHTRADLPRRRSVNWHCLHAGSCFASPVRHSA